jgi:glutamine synthetase
MAENLMKIMKDEDVQYVDLRFTDPRGKMQHVSFHKDMVDADFFVDGQMFDGSSDCRLEGDQRVRHGSDAGYGVGNYRPVLRPEDRAVFCDILEPITGEAYNRDPRTTAKKAEAFVSQSGVGDTITVGPEAEFFMFDDVRFER